VGDGTLRTVGRYADLCNINGATPIATSLTRALTDVVERGKPTGEWWFELFAVVAVVRTRPQAAVLSVAIAALPT
jgi:hypothetical protein